MRNSKVILHCILSMSGGGAERQFVYLAEGLVQLGWEVHAVFLYEGENLSRLSRSGAHILQLPFSSHYDPRIGWYLVRLLQRIQPQILQTWLPNMDMYGSLASVITRTPQIISERSASDLYPPTLKNRLRLFLGRWIAHTIVANSDEGLEYWASHVPGQKPTFVVPNSVPIDEIEKTKPLSRETQGIRADQEIILFAGRLTKAKNLQVLFPALEIVVRKRPQAIAIICGTGEQLGEWQQWLAVRHLTNQIKMMGYVTELWAWMKDADLFISPSLFEGQPNTVLEAMASRCPLVVSDIPQHRAFVDDRSAYIVSVEDAEGLVAATIRVLENRAEARQKSERAFEIVSQYTPQANVAQYDRIYRDIISSI